jgi:hypothetical protein
MNACRYLKGNNQKPNSASSAQRLIGSKVQYLRGRDIDKSGRGYYFPQTGRVTGAYRRTVEIDGDPVYFADLVELVVVS